MLENRDSLLIVLAGIALLFFVYNDAKTHNHFVSTQNFDYPYQFGDEKEDGCSTCGVKQNKPCPTCKFVPKKGSLPMF